MAITIEWDEREPEFPADANVVRFLDVPDPDVTVYTYQRTAEVRLTDYYSGYFTPRVKRVTGLPTFGEVVGTTLYLDPPEDHSDDVVVEVEVEN